MERRRGILLKLCSLIYTIINELLQKSIILDLDMKHLINGSLHNHKLNFNITIKTRSTNQGTVNINKTLNLISEVSLSLNGFVVFTNFPHQVVKHILKYLVF